MRDSNKAASLAELMGKTGKKDPKRIGLSDIKEILGEKMPEIAFDRVGRLRLISALSQRFGLNFRQMPGVENIIKEFDQEMQAREVIKQNKGDQNG